MATSRRRARRLASLENFEYAFYFQDQPVDPAANLNIPYYTTALEEALGLKLQTGRGPVDVWVIDSVQQPTEN